MPEWKERVNRRDRRDDCDCNTAINATVSVTKYPNISRNTETSSCEEEE